MLLQELDPNPKKPKALAGRFRLLVGYLDPAPGLDPFLTNCVRLRLTPEFKSELLSVSRNVRPGTRICVRGPLNPLLEGTLERNQGLGILHRVQWILRYPWDQVMDCSSEPPFTRAQSQDVSSQQTP